MKFDLLFDCLERLKGSSGFVAVASFEVLLQLVFFGGSHVVGIEHLVALIHHMPMVEAASRVLDLQPLVVLPHVAVAAAVGVDHDPFSLHMIARNGDLDLLLFVIVDGVDDEKQGGIEGHVVHDGALGHKRGGSGIVGPRFVGNHNHCHVDTMAADGHTAVVHIPFSDHVQREPKLLVHEDQVADHTSEHELVVGFGADTLHASRVVRAWPKLVRALQPTSPSDSTSLPPLPLPYPYPSLSLFPSPYLALSQCARKLDHAYC